MSTYKALAEVNGTPVLSTGDINAIFGLQIKAPLLFDLGFKPVHENKSHLGYYWAVSDLEKIAFAVSTHIFTAATKYIAEAQEHK